MAHIVQFRSSIARTEAGGEGEAQDGAQIIIFPGVRREYHAEMPAAPQGPGKERPERDRLELPD
jgi:hypothetical protein